MAAEGRDRVHVADEGRRVTIRRVSQEPLVVNGQDILAIAPPVEWEIVSLENPSAFLAGGLFFDRLAGPGQIALTSHREPLSLEVGGDVPLRTDPDATLGWTTGLAPQLHTDVDVKTFIGRGSHEAVQLEFRGEGTVLVNAPDPVRSGAGGGGGWVRILDWLAF